MSKASKTSPFRRVKPNAVSIRKLIAKLINEDN